MLTALVTSAGSGVSAAILEAAATRGDVRVVGATSAPDGAAADLPFAALHCVPPTEDAARFGAAVAAVAGRERPDVVLAGRDDDIAPLADLGGALAAVGARWSGPDAPFARDARDKAWVAAVLIAAGVPAAETATSHPDALALAARHGFPLIVKPRRGDGSRGVFLAHDELELETAFAEAGVPLVAQRYLQPFGRPLTKRVLQLDEYSVQMVRGPTRLAGPFATCNVLRDGVPVKAVAVARPELAHLASHVASVLEPLGWRGPLNLQARETARDRFEIFELNFRCTGLTGARTKMGFDELGALFGAECRPSRPPAAEGVLAAATAGGTYEVRPCASS